MVMWGRCHRSLNLSYPDVAFILLADDLEQEVRLLAFVRGH
jgi:hypothetical protein